MKPIRMIFGIFLFYIFTNLFIVSGAWGLTSQQIARKTFPSVVLLVMEDANGQPVSMGSGFFVKDNIVATNLHVIENANGGYAKSIGKKTKYNIAGTVGIDRDTDLVLLSTEGAKAPSLSLGNSGNVQTGDEVYAVGNPLGLEGTFSRGMVSGVRRVGSETVFQVTAPISPGSSGGPMVNQQGQVIGVTVATIQGGQNLNFAIPSYYLKQILTGIRVKPVKPLPGKTAPKKRKSISDSLGKRGIEGVVGKLFKWGFTYNPGSYSFSVHNKLREPVKDVSCLLVFYTNTGEPVDVNPANFPSIPAGLAKRSTGRVDGSVQELSSKVEIRVLDFQIGR